jgi:hypothetical protein
VDPAVWSTIACEPVTEASTMLLLTKVVTENCSDMEN